MKRTWITALAAGLAIGAVVFSYSGGLKAQGTPLGTRVACVDVVQLFNEYDKQKALAEEVKELENQLNQENQQRKQQMDALEATVSAMNPQDPAYVKKMSELLEMRIQWKNWFDIKQAHMTREVGVWTVNMYRDICAAVEEIAMRDGYQMVFFRDQFEQISMDPEAIREQIRMRKLLFAHPSADVTQLVLDKLNADFRAQPAAKMIQIP